MVYVYFSMEMGIMNYIWDLWERLAASKGTLHKFHVEWFRLNKSNQGRG
jgi:hypothetical protein